MIGARTKHASKSKKLGAALLEAVPGLLDRWKLMGGNKEQHGQGCTWTYLGAWVITNPKMVGEHPKCRLFFYFWDVNSQDIQGPLIRSHS